LFLFLLILQKKLWNNYMNGKCFLFFCFIVLHFNCVHIFTYIENIALLYWPTLSSLVTFMQEVIRGKLMQPPDRLNIIFCCLINSREKLIHFNGLHFLFNGVILCYALSHDCWFSYVQVINMTINTRDNYMLLRSSGIGKLLFFKMLNNFFYSSIKQILKHDYTCCS
jgi:hypothetical protein